MLMQMMMGMMLGRGLMGIEGPEESTQSRRKIKKIASSTGKGKGKETKMFCPECGGGIFENYKFCSSCGEKL